MVASRASTRSGNAMVRWWAAAARREIIARRPRVVGNVRLRSGSSALDSPRPADARAGRARSVVILDQSPIVALLTVHSCSNRRRSSAVYTVNTRSVSVYLVYFSIYIFTNKNGKQQSHQVWFRRRSATQSE